MAKAKYVNGKDLMLFIAGKAVALATSCSVTINADQLDANNKDDGCWAAQDAGTLSWEATTDALLSFDADRETDAVYETLFDAMVGRTLVNVTFGLPTNASTGCDGLPETGWEAPDTAAATPHYTGKAMITSLEATGENGSAATMSVTLSGNGALSKVVTA